MKARAPGDMLLVRRALFAPSPFRGQQMPDTCPLSARVAAGLAAPGSKLDAEQSAHLPSCEACRFAVSEALRRWPTETAPLAEWLREGTNETTITPYQAERLACGAPHELELGPYLRPY